PSGARAERLWRRSPGRLIRNRPLPLRRRVPVIFAAEDVLGRVLLRLVVAQLMRPAHPRGRLSAGAGVLVFAETRGFLRLGLIVPVLPPLRLDVPAEVALEKSN